MKEFFKINLQLFADTTTHTNVTTDNGSTYDPTA